MEGSKRLSLACDTKESTGSSSAGIFSSLFGTSSKAVESCESARPEIDQKKKDSITQIWNANLGTTETNRPLEAANQGLPSKDNSSYYQEQIIRPCNLSSSIYYGGQDMYIEPKKTQSAENPMYYIDVGEDDSGSAARGNWWKGSLYY